MRIEESPSATARVQGLRYPRMAIRRGVETESPRRLCVSADHGVSACPPTTARPPSGAAAALLELVLDLAGELDTCPAFCKTPRP